MSTDLSGKRAIAATQSSSMMLSSGSSVGVRRVAGRKRPLLSPIWVTRFMLTTPPVEPPKVSQLGLRVKQTEVNGPRSGHIDQPLRHG